VAVRGEEQDNRAMSSSSAGSRPPEGPEPSSTEGPPVTVAGVARRLGVAPATLRTWDRRYGLGPSEHTAGSHRRYTPADVGRLEIMRRLVLDGVSPADAAAAALATQVPAADTTPARAPVVPPEAGTAAASGRGGGGQVLPIGTSSAAARGLARAAMGLDAPAVVDIVSGSLDQRGVIATWEDLLLPVLLGVGRRYEATGRGVDVEHLLSESISTCLRRVAQQVGRPRNLRPVLLAAADEEQHTLPLHAVAAALAEHHIASRMLGGRVPRGALAAAVRRSGPLAVMVWAQVPERGTLEQIEALPALRPAPRVVLGGPGWPHELPPGVQWVGSLSEAVDRLLEVAR
jgi:transposase-like protein